MTGADAREQAHRALEGASLDGVTVIRGRPALRPASSGKPLIALLMALVFWSLVILHVGAGGAGLDPLGLLLRVVALGATLRAAWVLRSVAVAFREGRAAGRSGLALTEDGLLLRTDGRERQERWVERRRVLGVHAPEDPTKPPTLLLRPERGEGLLVLPPGLEDVRGRVSAELARWVGPESPPTVPPLPAADTRATELYQRAAGGAIDDGIAVVPRGWAFLRHGPYGALLLCAVLVERLVRLPDPAAVGALAWGALGLTLVVPTLWLVSRVRAARAGLGLALVITPAEVLCRFPSGILRAPFQKVHDVRIARRAQWSVLGGSRRARVLVIDRENGPPMVMSEDDMVADPAAIAALLERYRAGHV